MTTGSFNLNKAHGCSHMVESISCSRCVWGNTADDIQPMGNFHHLVQLREQHPENVDICNPFIWRLPVEVTSHIFSLCIIPTPLIDDFATLIYDFEGISNQVLLFQLTLRAVCRSWYYIASSNKMLWTSFSINLTPRSVVGVGKLAEEWLDRSGELPLVIRLLYNGRVSLYDGQIQRSELDGTGFSKPLLNAICTVSHRWDMVAFKLPNIFMQDLRCDVRRPPSCLRSLVLADSLEDPTTSGVLNLGFIPSPVRLRLDLPLEQVRLRWDKLTHFHATHFINIEAVVDILYFAPSLLYFCPTGLEFDLRNQNIIRHPNLQHLDIQNCFSTILDLFSFPALRELSVEGFHLEYDAGINFINRSQCRLHNLSIDGLGCLSTEELIVFLTSTPSLRLLELDHIELDSTFFDRFAESSNFLPNLSILSLDFDDPEFLRTFFRLLIPSTTSRSRPLLKIILRHEVDLGEEANSSGSEIATLGETNIRMIQDIRKSGVDFNFSTIG
ncbi:hypothetical protein CPB83DRAFT_618711, partial [Crepidotus variabilis]